MPSTGILGATAQNYGFGSQGTTTRYITGPGQNMTVHSNGQVDGSMGLNNAGSSGGHGPVFPDTFQPSSGPIGAPAGLQASPTADKAPTQKLSPYAQLKAQVLAAELAAKDAADTYGKGSTQYLQLNATATALKQALGQLVEAQASQLQPGTFRATSQGVYPYGPFDVAIKPSLSRPGGLALELVGQPEALFELKQETPTTFRGAYRSDDGLATGTVSLTRETREGATWFVQYDLKASVGAIRGMRSSGSIDLMPTVIKSLES